MIWVVTAQYSHFTYQPIVFGPFNTKEQANTFIAECRKAAKEKKENAPHLRITMLERPVIET